VAGKPAFDKPAAKAAKNLHPLSRWVQIDKGNRAAKVVRTRLKGNCLWIKDLAENEAAHRLTL